jgi:hypothetical protein
VKYSTRLFLVVTMFATLVGNAHAESPPDQRSVYVWDFATRDRKKTDLTEKLTHEFEVALIEYGTFSVLERRDIDRLIAQRENERAVMNLLEVPLAARKKLEARRADLVIFGEVFDDVASGQVFVTATVQGFDGTKQTKKAVLFSRGRQADAASRQAAMTELAQALAGAPAPVHSETVQGFLFELEECRRVQEEAVCTLRITNQDRDRHLAIYTKYKTVRSRIYDDANRESHATRANLAGKDNRFGYVYSLLLFGRSAKAVIHFAGLSPRARRIARLELTIGTGERKPSAKVRLRDIAIAP